MTMPTLFLTPRFTDDAQVLWRAALTLGWNVERLTSWRITEELTRALDPVVYVEALMAPTLAEQLGIKLSEPPVDWLPRLPEEYRNRWVRLSTLGEMRASADPFFVKPPNDKSFPARVYFGRDLPAEFPDDMPVLVAEVVEWATEFRCFILDRRLRTFSIYLRDGELQRQNDFACTEGEEMQLKNFLEPLLSDERVDLSRTAVLDVGVIVDRGWAVVEQNAAWGSGLYGCDPIEVLEVLRQSAKPLENATSNPGDQA